MTNEEICAGIAKALREIEEEKYKITEGVGLISLVLDSKNGVNYEINLLSFSPRVELGDGYYLEPSITLELVIPTPELPTNYARSFTTNYGATRALTAQIEDINRSASEKAKYTPYQKQLLEKKKVLENN